MAGMRQTPFSKSNPMAIRLALRLRRCRFAAALGVSFLTFAGSAQAQYPPMSPPPGAPAASVNRPTAPQAGPAPATVPGLNNYPGAPVPMTGPGANYYPGMGATQPACTTQMSCFDTIRESLCGDASAEG